MAYSDPFTNKNNVQWRGSTDSSRSSFEPRSSNDSRSIKIVVDAVYLKLNELDKINARIKKNIIVFKDLDPPQRRKVRELLQDAM